MNHRHSKEIPVNHEIESSPQHGVGPVIIAVPGRPLESGLCEVSTYGVKMVVREYDAAKESNPVYWRWKKMWDERSPECQSLYVCDWSESPMLGSRRSLFIVVEKSVIRG